MVPHLPEFRGDVMRDPAETDPWAGASGPIFLPPRAVVRPERAEDVATLVRWAVETETPIVPRGAGSGMPGGNVGPWVVMDLTRLDAVRLVEPDRIRAGAGAVAADAHAEAVRHGLDLPALPSSAPWCTLGGIAANDAAGARSFRYGPAHAWIEALEVVGSDGERRTLRRGAPARPQEAELHERLARMLPAPLSWPQVAKNASGYALDRFLETADPLDLWIGSEGTLGVVTGVELRALPPAPARGVALLGVPDRDDLPAVVEAARRVDAGACEWFGERLLELGGLGGDERLEGLVVAGGVCLVEVVGEDVGEVEASLARLEREVRIGGGLRTTTDPDRIEAFWGLRHDASPRIEALAGPSLRSTQFIEDCVVPVATLPAWLDGLDGVLEAAGLEAVLFGHAGDGNIHVNPLLDLSDAGWRETAREVLEAVVDLTAHAGGTLSGEHGDGRLRAPYTERIWGPDVARAFGEVKRTLDPAGVFNPGVILPLPGQDPLEGLGAAPDFAERNRGPARHRSAVLSAGAADRVVERAG